MKKCACFLILFFNFLCDASDKALAFYQKQDFDAALVVYAQKEYKSSADWYMMGNAAFYKEHYLQAIVFWHQSAIMGSSFYAKNVRENINRARGRLNFDELKELPLLYPFGLNELITAFAVPFFLFSFVWVLAFLFIFYYRFRSPFIRLFLFICFLIVTFFVYQKLSSVHQGYSGIIVSKSPVLMHVGPSDEYHTTEQIMPKELVMIVSQTQNWYKIYYKNSFGWVSCDSLMTAYSAAQSYVSSGSLE